MSNTVRFKYVFDEEYDPEYVNGVLGGINPSGELVMNFFMDRSPVPYLQEMAVMPDGSLSNKVVAQEPEKADIRRVVKNGVIMNASTALTIYQWMKQRLIEMGVDENEL